ncbi:MAG: GNAT family N-acetyltransferase [Flavobacteriaceae bacterium]|jgi:ribosomal-protein-alanine N-acetyltransferase|nr:GNAT family N-acetyltransferase [Flavobacteriaceae bacterium]
MMQIDLPIFPIIETERLILRRLVMDDTPAIFAMRSNPEIMRYIPVSLSQTTDDAQAYISSIDQRMASKECINWAITLKENDVMIGTIGIFRIALDHYRGEVGYTTLSEFNGKGYVTEALTTIVDYGFNALKFHSLGALVDPDNIGSVRVLEKCGFEKEGHIRDNWFFEGKFIDTAIYSKLNKK